MLPSLISFTVTISTIFDLIVKFLLDLILPEVLIIDSLLSIFYSVHFLLIFNLPISK